MGQDAQTPFAGLTIVTPSSRSRSEVAFEHAKDRFDLPALTIGVSGKSLFHQPAITTPDRAWLAIAAWAAALRRRDDTANAELLSAKRMEAFGFTTGIPQQTPERRMTWGLV